MILPCHLRMGGFIISACPFPTMTTSDSVAGTRARAVGVATSAVLVGVAFAGAATAGTLSTVGPYLLGISGLLVALFAAGFVLE